MTATYAELERENMTLRADLHQIPWEALVHPCELDNPKVIEAWVRMYAPPPIGRHVKKERQR